MLSRQFNSVSLIYWARSISMILVWLCSSSGFRCNDVAVSIQEDFKELLSDWEMNSFPFEWSHCEKSFSEVLISWECHFLSSTNTFNKLHLISSLCAKLTLQTFLCQDVSIIFGITTAQSFLFFFSQTHQTFAQPLLSIGSDEKPRKSFCALRHLEENIINWFRVYLYSVKSLAYKKYAIVR